MGQTPSHSLCLIMAYLSQ